MRPRMRVWLPRALDEGGQGRHCLHPHRDVLMHRFVLLPGLDGTGALFEQFRRTALAAGARDVDIVALPAEPLGYDALAARLAPSLRLDANTVLVAESFSGPLAILLAARASVGAVVLCNSFVVAPRSSLLRALAVPWWFRARPPAALVRRFLVGPAASDALVEEVQRVVASVPAHVVASRLRSVLTVDVVGLVTHSTTPILCVIGTEDRVVPASSVEAIVRAAGGGATVARIAGPHLILQAAPVAAWSVIERFVAQRAGS